MKKGRPLKSNKKRVRVSFTLHPDDVEWLEAEAKHAGESKSFFLTKLIQSAQRGFEGEGSDDLLELNVHIPVKILEKVCQKYKLSRLAIFGSALTEDFHPQSDIDVLVQFRKGEAPGMFALARLKKELSQLFGGRDVDLRTLNEISPNFRKKVLEQSRELYAA